MAGNQFDVGDEICGAVVSIRQTEDLLSIWNKTAIESKIRYKIKETIKKVLKLPIKTEMEYKVFQIKNSRIKLR
jgi:translation initiation factor 4E